MYASHYSFSYSCVAITATPENRRFLYMTVMIANLVALCGGMQIAWSSPCLPKIQEAEHLADNPLRRLITVDEASWIGSLLAVGGCLGTKLAEISVDKIGRKKSIVVTSIIPFLCAYLLIVSGEVVYAYYLARLLAGIAVSGVFTVIPIYLAEIAEDCNRGLICCSMVAFQALGHLVTYTFGYALSFTNFGYFCLGTVLLAGILIVALIPESPYYLVGIGDRSGAEKALIKIRATIGRGIANELMLIKIIVEDYQDNIGSMIDIFATRALRKAQIISVSLVVFQTLSGISPVLYYAQTIFAEAGTDIEPAHCVIILGVVQLIVSSITPHLVEKFGRKVMLFTSSAGACLSDVLMGTYFYCKQTGSSFTVYLTWAPVVSLVVFMIFYFVGLGPLVWTVMAEVFPNDVKAAAASFTVMVSWVLTFVLCKFFAIVADMIGMAGLFWFFAASNCVSAIFCTTYLVETRGKNFQQIQQLLRE